MFLMQYDHSYIIIISFSDNDDEKWKNDQNRRGMKGMVKRRNGTKEIIKNREKKEW